MKPRNVQYAKWYERLIAYLFDQFGASVFAAVVLALLIIMGVMKVTGTPEEPTIDQSGFAVMFVCFMAYYVVSVGSRWQATPGQRLMRLYVMRTDRRALTLLYSLERFLAYIIPTLPVYVSFLPENISSALWVSLNIFWFAPILFTPEGVGLHDRLCNTRVVVGRANA